MVHAVKRALATLLKLAASVAMLGYLGWRASNDPQFVDLVRGSKNWLVLAAALPIGLAAVSATILRWHMLVRALGLKFPFSEALRAGFISYMVNLLPLGLVGGDSLKAIMLIRHEPRRKTEAVATVLIDRVLGLYALLLLATLASCFLPADQFAGLSPAERGRVERLTLVVRLATVIGSVGLGLMLIPAVTQSRLWDRLEHAPVLGPVLQKLVGAMRAYRRALPTLLAAIGISLFIHTMYVTLVTLLVLGLRVPPEHRPAGGMLFVIVPPSMIAGALPIGGFEFILNLLYRSVAPAVSPPNLGFLLALGYRVVQICIASIGLVYWLGGRSDVRKLVHEAELNKPTGELAGPPSLDSTRATVVL